MFCDIVRGNMKNKKKKIGIIYSAECITNGKLYIGQSWHYNKRKRDHITRSEKSHYPFGRAIKKYGKENFKWKILYQTTRQEELDYVEKWYIKEFKTKNRHYGYNLEGGGSHGRLHEATKKKLSKIFAGENGNNAKFNWNKVNEIRNKYLTGEFSILQLSKEYKCDKETLRSIINNVTWVCKKFSEKEKEINAIKFKFQKGAVVKLNMEKAMEIRKKAAEGISHKQLANEYNVHKCHISKIVCNKKWKI
jgi:group I intron endonuclease